MSDYYSTTDKGLSAFLYCKSGGEVWVDKDEKDPRYLRFFFRDPELQQERERQYRFKKPESCVPAKDIIEAYKDLSRITKEFH